MGYPARGVAEKINQHVDLPFLNEKQEQVFFELVVTTLFEIVFGNMLQMVQTQAKKE